MNKNYGLVIAVIFLLLMGTGTFVFANDTDEDFGNTSSNQTTKQLEDSKQEDIMNNDDNVKEDGSSSDNENEASIIDISQTNNVNLANSNFKPNNNGTTNIINNGNSTLPPNNNNSDNENNNINSGNNNENNEQNPDNNNPEVLPSFQFVNGGTFSNNEIIINDPNYGYMTVYNRFTGKTDRVESNKYIVTMNTLYTFTVYDKNGNVMQTAKMTFDNVAPNVSSVATSATGSETVVSGKIYDKVKITFTDNELSVIKRVYEDGHEEILKQYTINDFDYGKFEKTFTESGHYKIVAYDVALNSRSIEFTIK